MLLISERVLKLPELTQPGRHLFNTQQMPSTRSIDAIPQLAQRFLQHATRAIYQAGHVWGQAHIRAPDVPSQSHCAGKIILQNWIHCDIVARSSSVLVQIAYGVALEGCRGRCKCVKADLKCTSLCNWHPIYVGRACHPRVPSDVDLLRQGVSPQCQRRRFTSAGRVHPIASAYIYLAGRVTPVPAT
ncbi:hypothetical protein GWK47_049259 [Chionoecetes opilio]|uniref:Uncharacterized protein n=1 Tax=Chionoecetes opilio TaxID=41210 RepID=A0A8J4Y3N4_CHIOP|nr:hypothetical protein GWK47_049259 [Chionoecetes opilio]